MRPVPSCANVVWPQHHRPVSLCPQVCRAPAANTDAEKVPPPSGFCTAVARSASGPPPWPSWPLELLPQHHRSPCTEAQLCALPPTRFTTRSIGWLLVASVTGTGATLGVRLPVPSSPLELSPQHSTPRFWSAQVCCSPATRSVTPERFGTRVGTRVNAPASGAPEPSCPYAFEPQHHTLESDARTAQACSVPAANAVTGSSATSTGTGLFAAVPSPSCPSAFAPQQNSFPSVRRAQVYCRPPCSSTRPRNAEPSAVA